MRLTSKVGRVKRVSYSTRSSSGISGRNTLQNGFKIEQSGSGADDLDHAIAAEVDTQTTLLQTRDHAGAGWMAKARQLSEKVHHHLREEEKKFFQVSGRILSATKKAQLARQYRRDYARMRKELEAE